MYTFYKTGTKLKVIYRLNVCMYHMYYEWIDENEMMRRASSTAQQGIQYKCRCKDKYFDFQVNCFFRFIIFS